MASSYLHSAWLAGDPVLVCQICGAVVWPTEGPAAAHVKWHKVEPQEAPDGE